MTLVRCMSPRHSANQWSASSGPTNPVHIGPYERAGIGRARGLAVLAMQLPSPEPMPVRSRLHETGDARNGCGARAENSSRLQKLSCCSGRSRAKRPRVKSSGAWHKRLYNSYSASDMSRTKAIFAGLIAGLLAGIVMTTAMLLLAALGVATPLVIIGDRLSVFIPPGPFLSLMGKVGGYNHLKQLGVGSTIAGQLVVAAIGGAIFGLLARRNPARALSDLDDVDLCCVADRCLRSRAVAGIGHELRRSPYRGCAPGHARRLCALRVFVRANARRCVFDF